MYELILKLEIEEVFLDLLQIQKVDSVSVFSPQQNE